MQLDSHEYRKHDLRFKGHKQQTFFKIRGMKTYANAKPEDCHTFGQAWDPTRSTLLLSVEKASSETPNPDLAHTRTTLAVLQPPSLAATWPRQHHSPARVQATAHPQAPTDYNNRSVRTTYSYAQSPSLRFRIAPYTLPLDCA
ncbi:hypothetical protein P170DRAFT_431287 [Aspergillus steynii IBT 23096]|uniref:Uncharacterized protein n=1 Tax=Aspergillus steynii IBT 23096 TaxID=1392250 RepID=A0A2I2FRS4_9EURO|nr:uncharacterized protein P170DRAFT_431287 [Aspergillus steynii IBT 23096]PLB43338.1 hypothetical protein P170DRAFT_431287 [Aspergillus steynii IBT 23096]